MYRTKKFLERQTPFTQLIILIMLMLFSMLLTFFVGVLLAVPFFGVGVAELLGRISEAESNGDIGMLKYFQIISQLGIFIIPSIVFALLASYKFTEYLRINFLPGVFTAIITGILIFTILPGINLLVEINEALSLPGWLSGIENWMRESEENAARLTELFLKADGIKGLLLNLFMVALLASVGEELLFRGVLLRIFGAWFKNIHLAVWVSAILFSMFHLQFFGFLPRLMLGVVFGYLLVWTGSLWAPILAHFINNAAAVIVYYFYQNGVTDLNVESFGTLENKFLLMISIFISVALMLVIYYQNQRRTPSGEDDY